MSDDALAALLAEGGPDDPHAPMPHVLPCRPAQPCENCIGMAEWLDAQGVVVLSRAVAEVLRMGEPSEAMIEAAFDEMASALQRYANLGDFGKVRESVRVGLRAALAVIRI